MTTMLVAKGEDCSLQRLDGMNVMDLLVDSAEGPFVVLYHLKVDPVYPPCLLLKHQVELMILIVSVNIIISFFQESSVEYNYY